MFCTCQILNYLNCNCKLLYYWNVDWRSYQLDKYNSDYNSSLRREKAVGGGPSSAAHHQQLYLYTKSYHNKGGLPRNRV